MEGVAPLQSAILREKKEKKRGEEEQQPQKCARRRAEDEANNSASVDSSLPTFLLLSRQVRKNLSPRHIQRDQGEKKE